MVYSAHCFLELLFLWVYPSPESFVSSVTKGQEVLLGVQLLKPFSLNSWNLCCLLCEELMCVRKWTQMAFQCEVKAFPRWWKQAVCSCPDLQNRWGHRWDFSLVDFSSDLPSLCLARHGNLSWNGQTCYWMKEDLRLSLSMNWIGCKRQSVKVLYVGQCWDEVSIMRKAHAVSYSSLPFDFRLEKGFSILMVLLTVCFRVCGTLIHNFRPGPQTLLFNLGLFLL